MSVTSNIRNCPCLVVAGGLHEAAAVEIRSGATRVGADPSADVVVTDMSVPFAFRLAWNGRKLVLEAIDAAATLSGRTLAAGRSSEVREDSDLLVAGVAFRLAMPHIAAIVPARAHSGFAAGVAATLALAGVAALIAAPSPPPFAPPAAAPALARPQLSIAVPVAHAAPDDHVLLDDLRRQLASSNLDGISVDRQPDGALAATGRIARSQDDAWHAAKRWFDAAAAGRAVLVDNVDVSSAATALQIQAVYTGPTAYVIDGDGQKLFLGSALADGSVVQRIEATRVLLRHGDQTIAVRFR